MQLVILSIIFMLEEIAFWVHFLMLWLAKEVFGKLVVRDPLAESGLKGFFDSMIGTFARFRSIIQKRMEVKNYTAVED